MQTFTHYFLHFGFIAIIAYFWDKENWKYGYFILLSTMLVDLDHGFATPVFDAERCSIGYHYLHLPIPILIYFVSFLLIKNRYIKLFFLGLLFHMLTDTIDCFWMFSKCQSCFEQTMIYDWVMKIQ